MANFAKIGLNNKVIEVVTVNNDILLDADGNEDENLGIEFLTSTTNWPLWVQTSYNKTFRKNYAGKGFEWDEDRNAFIEPKPKNEGSWILDETTCTWKRPVDKPGDSNGLNYSWDEDAYQADNTAGWVSSANNQVSDGS